MPHCCSLPARIDIDIAVEPSHASFTHTRKKFRHFGVASTFTINLPFGIPGLKKAMGDADGKPEHGSTKAFGIDFSKGDLADVFATCVSCFNRAIDRAPSATKLELSVIRLRLTRWGEAVKIYEKPALGHYDPDPDELYATRQALIDIITLFDTGNPAVNVIATHLNDMDKEARLLQESLGAIASERPLEGNNLLGSQDLGLDQWSGAQSKHASSIILRLENLFGSQHLRELCAIEQLRISNEGAIKRLRAVANSLDPWMSDDITGTYTFLSVGAPLVNMCGGAQFNNMGSGAQFLNMGPGTQFIGGGVKFKHSGKNSAP